MEINRNNYEAFFLMYVDQELSATEREMVDAFIRQHPDLKAELDLLLDTVSAGDESVRFDDKEKLMAVNGFREEELLTYMDGESGPEMSAAIEKAVGENDEMKQHVALLEKLYFKPDMSVIYPAKDALYRRARVTKMDWWRIAVAASLLLLVSAWLFLYKDEPDRENPVAVIDTVRTEPSKAIIQQAVPVDTTPVKNVVIESQKYVNVQRQDNESQKSPSRVAVSPSEAPVANRQSGNGASEVVQAAQVNGTEKPVAPAGSAPVNNVTAAVKEVQVQSTINETVIQTPTAAAEIPVKEKKNSLFKKIGKKIGDRALDILSADGDDIQVAGFAINLKK